MVPRIRKDEKTINPVLSFLYRHQPNLGCQHTHTSKTGHSYYCQG